MGKGTRHGLIGVGIDMGDAVNIPIPSAYGFDSIGWPITGPIFDWNEDRDDWYMPAGVSSLGIDVAEPSSVGDQAWVGGLKIDTCRDDSLADGSFRLAVEMTRIRLWDQWCFAGATG